AWLAGLLRGGVRRAEREEHRCCDDFQSVPAVDLSCHHRFISYNVRIGIVETRFRARDAHAGIRSAGAIPVPWAVPPPWGNYRCERDRFTGGDDGDDTRRRMKRDA